MLRMDTAQKKAPILGAIIKATIASRNLIKKATALNPRR
jgi:hypothetical protein